MKNIAIILARSGSKGLVNKNIRILNGKPLLAWSIEAAKESGLFNEIMVSTDSEEYSCIARTFGASVPFLRSTENSSDKASSWDAVRETLCRYKEELGQEYDTVCLLQPTSPLRRAIDLQGAYALFEEKGADTVISVCEADHSPLWMSTVPPSLSLEGFDKKEAEVPRQALSQFYRINGAVYITKTEGLLSKKNIYENGYAYIMDRVRSIDIDTEFDFELAEFLMEKYAD